MCRRRGAPIGLVRDLVGQDAGHIEDREGEDLFQESMLTFTM